MNFPTPPRFARLCRVIFLSTLIPFALATAGCSTVKSVLPTKGERVEALELDPTEDHALVEVQGARWVLFNLDFDRGARRILRGAFDGAASVGQSVGQKIVEARPEEKIMEMFQAARESSRFDQARGAWIPATPSFPTSAVP